MKRKKLSKQKPQDTSTSPSLKKSESIQYPHDKLINALFWVWDGFDRAQMGMFLVYGTLESAVKNVDLTGDKVEVGVRNMEWKSGSKPILLAFLGNPVEENDDYSVFKNPFNEVPVYVYLFDEFDCIRHNNTVLYRNEYFCLPNPYSEFRELFGTVWEK